MDLKTRVLAIAGAGVIAGGIIAMTSPEASAGTVPGGFCGGSLTLAKITPGLNDTVQDETMTTSLLKDTGTHAPIGGTCNEMVQSPRDTAVNGPAPASLSVGAIATKLTGSVSCQDDQVGQYPLTGKQTITGVSTQLNGAGKKWEIESYFTVEESGGTLGAGPDDFLAEGLVTKGLGVGESETALDWWDPVVKGVDPEGDGENNPAADGANHSDDNIFNSGYSVDENSALPALMACGDGTAAGELPQTDAITQMAIGSGGATDVSPLFGGEVLGTGFYFGVP